MDQEKIGRFIAEMRKKKNLTQSDLGERLKVSTNAVSKWERGICLMDMSLLKPLANILEVQVLDILSGEIVSKKETKDKYEETIYNLAKLQKDESKAFGIYGLILMFIVLVIFKSYAKMNYSDIMSTVFMVVSFKFIYKYKSNKGIKNILISIIAFIFSLIYLADFIKSAIWTFLDKNIHSFDWGLFYGYSFKNF